MEAEVTVKVRIITSNPHATPHRIGEVLEYGIKNIQSDADYEVLEWQLNSYDPKKT